MPSRPAPSTLPRPRTDLRGRTVLVVHAHPDDEAIFTGITLRRLADAGARTVLVLATAGELGGSKVALRAGESVAQRRTAELETAAGLLGVARLVLLGRRDSGLPGGADTRHAAALAGADPTRLARRIAALAESEGADTIVHDDEPGIYGHPDHAAVGRIGARTATLIGATGYRVTVDREHLHLVARDGHLVHGAARAAAGGYGRTTVEIGLALAARPDELAGKRAAILAHASQVGPADIPADRFAAAYGHEWFLRSGPPGALDALGNAHLFARAA